MSSKSSKKISVPKPLVTPATPDGKKRCHNCEQVYPLKKAACPHCKSAYSASLSDVDPTAGDLSVQEWMAFEEKTKRLRNSKKSSSRTELAALLFQTAMIVRYTQPRRSLEMFNEVASLEPENYEARIKVSWLSIKFKDFVTYLPLLEAVVHPDSRATPEQRQRAYNNIVCSYMFRPNPDFFTAEKLVRTGIAIDEKGSVKLWENLGMILKQLGRYSEARDAYQTVLKLDPQSDFAKQMLLTLHKKDKSKSLKQSGGGGNKENSTNFEILKRSKTSKRQSAAIERI